MKAIHNLFQNMILSLLSRSLTVALTLGIASSAVSAIDDSTGLDSLPPTTTLIDTVQFTPDTTIAKAPGIIDIYEEAGDPFKGEFQWFDVSDSDWSVTVTDSTKSYDAITIFDYTRAKDKPRNNASITETYFRRHILNAAGKDQYADITYILRKGTFDSFQLLGRTVLPNGTTYPLDTSLIIREEVEAPDGSMMERISFSLPGVTSDCIIESYLTYIDYASSSHSWYYQSEIPTLKCKYFWYPAKSKYEEDELDRLLSKYFADKGILVRISGSEKIHASRDKRSSAYVWQNTVGKINTTIIPENSPTVLVFSARDVPAFTPEPYSMPEMLQQARVVMYRTDLTDTKSYWKNISRQLNTEVASIASKKKRLLKAVKKIKKDKSRDQWIVAAYDWTQHQLWNTDHESWYSEEYLAKKTKKRKRPKSRSKKKSKGKTIFIDDMLKMRSANSEEINMIFCEALWELGFKAYLAYVTNRDSSMFSANLPYWQFEHAIVLVKTTGSNYVGYDPSTPYLTPGQLRWQNQGVSALVIGDNSNLFAVTPVSTASENTLVRSLTVNHIHENELRAHSSERFRGQMAGELRAALWPHDSAYHVQEIKRMFFPDASNVEIDSLQISGMWNREEALVINFTIRQQHSAASAEDRLFISLRDIFGEYTSPFATTERLKPIIFDFPYTVTESAVIELGQSWQLQTKPDDVSHSGSLGSCKLTINSFSGAVSIQRRFQIARPFIDKAQYQDVLDLFGARESLNEEILSLTRSQ